MDETWVHYYTHETNHQSKQWTYNGSLPPKKAKVFSSTNKIMEFFFGILEACCQFKKGHLKHRNIMLIFSVAKLKIFEKTPCLGKNKILYHHNNAPDRSDHHPFPNLKNVLAGMKFPLDNEVTGLRTWTKTTLSRASKNLNIVGTSALR